MDEPVGAPDARKTAVLAGGCFWGVQGVYEHVKGVDRAVSGYAKVAMTRPHTTTW